MTTRTPAPVNVPVVPTTTGPIDRAPAPVSPAVDPELPRTPVPVLRPSAVTPAAAPTPYRSTATTTPVLPIEEEPVDLTPPAESEDRNIIPANTPRYVTVLEDGTVVVSEAAQLNFSGSGVTVTAQGSTANIVITGGSGSSYTNANVAAFLAAYGSNTIVTTGNITGGYLFGNGSQLTGISAGANIGNLDIIGTDITIASDASETQINISPNGESWSYLQIPNDATANTANVRLHNDAGNIEIATGDFSTGSTSSSYNWYFDNTGNLTLPLSANIVGATANNFGYLGWLGNSSGDGNGYTTMRLVPDDTVEGNDQYLILDPTAPGHIHIRAGGTQDNSSADLILGGENSFVKIAAGANSDVFVRSDSNDWRFGTDGVLTLPGEGVLQSMDDTVTLSSFNTSTGNANSVYLGSGGGLGFSDQAIGGNWLEIFRNGEEPQITVPVGRGNLNIQTAQGENSYNWTFDNSGTLTAPGDITVGGDITGTSGASTLVLKAQPDSNTAIQLNNIVDSAIRTVANLEIRTNVSNTAQVWTFDTAGTLTAPGNISASNIELSGNVTAAVSVTNPRDISDLTPINGGRAFAADANLVAAGNFGAQVSGGGSNTVPVWSDGTNWYIG